MNVGIITTNSSYRWIIFIFTYLAFCSQYIAYLSWNPFIPLSTTIFNFSMHQSSSIVATAALGRVLFQIPGGMLTDRFETRPLLCISLFALGISSLIACIGGTYQTIIISQFLIGATGVLIWPLCIKIIIDWFPMQEHDFVVGLLNTGVTVAVIAINILIPYAIHHLEWRSVFYIIGLLCIGITVATSLFIKSTPVDDTKITLANTVPNKKMVNFADIISLLKSKKFRLGIIVYAGSLYTSWGLNTWLTTYLIHEVNLSIDKASIMMMVFGICGSFSMPIVGIITRGNRQKRYTFLAANLALLAILVIILPWIQSQTILWGYMIVLGIATFAYMGPVNLMVADLVDTKVFGTAMAVLIFLWLIASMFQSLLIGRVLDIVAPSIAYHLTFWILAVGAFVGSLSIVKINFD